MSATLETADEPQDQSALGRQVARGALWSVLSVAIATPFNLAVTAYSLAKLGAEAYGVWVLIAIFGNYLKLGDFGLSAAFARTVAEGLATGDTRSLGRSLSSVLS